jgi:hypothetical protein
VNDRGCWSQSLAVQDLPFSEFSGHLNPYAIRNPRAGILRLTPLVAERPDLDSYIIRIYRRGAESGKEIAGLISA